MLESPNFPLTIIQLPNRPLQVGIINTVIDRPNGVKNYLVEEQSRLYHREETNLFLTWLHHTTGTDVVNAKSAKRFLRFNY